LVQRGCAATPFGFLRCTSPSREARRPESTVKVAKSHRNSELSPSSWGLSTKHQAEGKRKNVERMASLPGRRMGDVSHPVLAHLLDRHDRGTLRVSVRRVDQ